MNRFVEFGILAVFLLSLILGSVSLFGWEYVHDKLRKERKEDVLGNQRGQSLALYGCGTAVVVGFLAIVLVLLSGANVSPGHVGVVSTASSGIDVKQQPLTQGFHMVMPFVTHIESVSVQPQNHKFQKVAAASKELQNVYVDGGVNYHINPDVAATLVISGGVEAIVSRVFDPAFQDYIKEVVPQYATTDILPNRSKIRDEVKARLADKARTYGIVVDDVFITNIDFDKAYTQAIEQKQVAAQQLEQAKVQAQTAVAKAKGEADALVAQAQGDAQANKLRAAYLTPELILYLEILKWNGILPTTTGVGGVFATVGK